MMREREIGRNISKDEIIQSLIQVVAEKTADLKKQKEINQHLWDSMGEQLEQAEKVEKEKMDCLSEEIKSKDAVIASQDRMTAQINEEMFQVQAELSGYKAWRREVVNGEIQIAAQEVDIICKKNAEIGKVERSNAALRGVITKLKKGGG